MKKFLLALVVLSGAAFSSFAQSSDAGKFSIGVEAGLPVGDASNGYTFAIGGSVKYDHPIAEGTFINLSAGYTTLLGKDIAGLGKVPNFNAIPVKAGLKYFFSEGFYGEAQLGAAFVSQKIAGVSYSTTAFAYAPGVGYSFGGGLDAGVRYEAWSKNGTTSQVALRVAYSF